MNSNRSGQGEVKRIVLIPSRQDPEKVDPEYKYLPPIKQVNQENVDPKWFEYKVDKNIEHRAYSGMTVHNNFLYLYGGYQVTVGIMGDFYRMDLKAPQFHWEQLQYNENPGPRCRFQLTAFGDRLFMFGGQEKQSISTNSVWIYETSLRNWSKAKINQTYPPIIDNYACTQYNNQWIIFGGFFGGDVGLHSNYIYSYDFQTNQWQRHQHKEAQAPAPRDGTAISMIGDNLYMFGGSNGHQRFNDLWTYSFVKQFWLYIPVSSQFLPRVRSGHNMITYGNKLLVFGGIHDVTWELDDLFQFDTKKNEWSSIDEDSARRKESLFPPSPAKESNQPSKQNFRKSTRSSSIRKTQKRIPSPRKQDNSEDSVESPTRNLSLAMANQKTLEEKKKKDILNKKLAMLKLFEVDEQDRQQYYSSSPTSENIKNSLLMIGNPKSDLKTRPGRLTEFGKPLISRFLQPLSSMQNMLQGRRPCARDGHASAVFGDRLLIFGGDRHQMSFNDIYALELQKINN